MDSSRLRALLPEIYQAALEAVDPETAVRRAVQLEGATLQVGRRRYTLTRFRKIFLIGAGKAAVPMARAAEGILGERLERGVVVVKYGHGGSLERTEVLESGHPEPDRNGLAASARILQFLDENLGAEDLLLVVISGGGSALLPAPVAAVPFEDKLKTTGVLLRCGADIHEINTIRKHLSRIKGGRLLRHTGGAQVIALLLSDVVGDQPASIASGPTAADPSTFQDCLDIIRKYEIAEDLPPAVLKYLKSGGEEETVKPGDPLLDRVQNVVVANNLLALQSAAARAKSLGFRTLILSSSMEGNTADVARVHVALAREVLSSGHPLAPPCCLISGGETTVQVQGNGKGGRNQEFALWCALGCSGWDHPVLFASLGSDGNDGPTDAAGALATPATLRRAAEQGLETQDYLRRNDSYHFFRRLDDLIVTGPTRTNVMDVRLVMIG